MEDSPRPAPVVVSRRDHPVSRKGIDSDALWILQKLRREGYAAYLVGGAVRDLMLGREPKDFDVGTDARPSEIKRVFRNCRIIGRRFRLAHVYFRRKGEPDKVVEVSTFRSLAKPAEVEPDDIPPEDLDLAGTAFGTPEEDAWRRDFTVNALFYNLEDFTVIDHVGGLADLEGREIRVIGDPDERFQEDPVRMLRAVEFAVRLGFRIEAATEAGIRRNANCLDEASPARLREELRQLEQRGIMAPTLAEAERLGLAAVLLPEVKDLARALPLLATLDARAAEGNPASEGSYLAALLLPTVVGRLPLRPSVGLEEAVEAIAEPTGAITQRYQIAAHVRHGARELLLSCYRIARGKAYRAKGRFVRRPEFHEAWGFVQGWAEATGELTDAVAFWRAYLGGQEPPTRAKKAARTASEDASPSERPPKRRRRRRGRKRGAAPTPAE